MQTTEETNEEMLKQVQHDPRSDSDPMVVVYAVAVGIALCMLIGCLIIVCAVLAL